MKLSELTLIHYSDEPLVKVCNAATRDIRRNPYFKPIGLWVSVKGPHDWAAWCESESFRDIANQYEAQIVLVDGANVLHLADECDIDRFTSKYTLPPRYQHDRAIDWPRVAVDYDGIVIAPYCWSRRMTDHTFWYYGWDCASGCIWNSRAVLYVSSVPKLETVSQ